MRTVIVRLFEPAPGAGQAGLHGFVEDVEAGTKSRFDGPVQLLGAIERIVRLGDEPAPQEGPVPSREHAEH